MSCNCCPEGTGIYLAQSAKYRKRSTIAIVTVGYRNASVLLGQRGSLTHGQSELLGMSHLAELVEERISIRSHRQLVRVIAKAGPELETKALAPALPIGDPQLQEQELERLREAIRAASQEYLKSLASWL